MCNTFLERGQIVHEDPKIKHPDFPLHESGMSIALIYLSLFIFQIYLSKNILPSYSFGIIFGECILLATVMGCKLQPPQPRVQPI